MAEAIVEDDELAVRVNVPADKILIFDKVSNPAEVDPLTVPLKEPLGSSDRETEYGPLEVSRVDFEVSYTPILTAKLSLLVVG